MFSMIDLYQGRFLAACALDINMSIICLKKIDFLQLKVHLLTDKSSNEMLPYNIMQCNCTPNSYDIYNMTLNSLSIMQYSTIKVT